MASKEAPETVVMDKDEQKLVQFSFAGDVDRGGEVTPRWAAQAWKWRRGPAVGATWTLAPQRCLTPSSRFSLRG